MSSIWLRQSFVLKESVMKSCTETGALKWIKTHSHWVAYVSHLWLKLIATTCVWRSWWSACSWHVELCCIFSFVHFLCPLSRALETNKYNHITATYFLLAERILREKQEKEVQPRSSSPSNIKAHFRYFRPAGALFWRMLFSYDKALLGLLVLTQKTKCNTEDQLSSLKVTILCFNQLVTILIFSPLG